MAKLFVIAGHGAGDPGACGNGYSEAERVRALAQRIKTLGGNNVTLGDVNRNYYADNGISTLNISKDYQIIELHMDAASASARGGHVIINAGFSPDSYDNAIANMISKILPGRSKLIVARNDLANPARAAAKGYGYRLVEFGFITNATDVGIFNSKMDEIARGVLSAFGISSSSSNKTTSNTTTTNNKGGNNMKEVLAEIWAVKDEAGQYYFDGSHVHGFSSQTEKKLLVGAYKRITGKDINVHTYTRKEINQLIALLKRIS